MAWLASAFSSIHARRPKKVRRRDLTSDVVVVIAVLCVIE